MKEIQFILDKNPILKSRKLILSQNSIRLFERNSISFTEFSKESIKDFRFGIRWYRGRYFYIGRGYQIVIRNNENKEIKICKKSLYRIGVTKHHELYISLVKALYDFYFNDIARSLYQKFLSGEPVSISNVDFSKEGITILIDKIIKEKRTFIEWNDVGVKYYTTHLTIYSKANTVNVNHGYYYLTDWNAGILHVLMKWMIKD